MVRGMQTFDAIQARLTAHRWQPVPVADALIDRCLAAAQLAPCHKHTWPWRFISVGPATRAEMVRIAVEKAGDASEKKKALIRAKLGAGGLIVALQQVADDPHRAKEDYAACACAIQNICLVAADAGVYSKWSTGSITKVPEILALFGVGADEEVIGFIFLGTPADDPKRIPRPDLEAVTRRLP